MSDATGNRRFWPIRIPSPIRIDELKRDRDQLLAEAVYRYKAEESFLMSKDAQRIAEQEQEQALSSDPWEESVRSYISEQLQEDYVTIDKLIDHIQGVHESKFQVNQFHKTRVSKILQMLGWEKKRSSAEGRPRIYQPGNNAKVLPEFKKSEQETQPASSFLIDHPCPEEASLNKEDLEKLRRDFIELLEISSSDHSIEEICISQLESDLHTLLQTMVSYGLTSLDCWAAVERATGSWKEARFDRENYYTAYKALAKLLSMKVTRQH